MNGRVRIYNHHLLRPGLYALLLFSTAAGLRVFAQTPAEMADLAQKYEKGIGCPRDIGKALVFYKRAAAEGEMTSMVALGDLYRDGVCVEQDLKYSTDMYRQAANAGFAPGMMRFGMALERSGRLPDATVWFRKAAAKGYGPAMTHLGDIMADSEWYRQAVVAKDPPAFARLAETVPSTEAVQLLKQGAELGDPVAQWRYAERIEKQDPATAVKLYRSAAEAGEPVAMSRVAYFAEKSRDAGEAALWYNKAAEKGDPEGIFWRGRQAEAAGNIDEARRLYKIAGNKGSAGALARLARLTGDKNMWKAAADGGDPDAMYEVAKESNDPELMKRAAALGNIEALVATGQTEKAADRGHVASLVKMQRWEEAAKAESPEGLYRWGLSIPDKNDGTRYIRQAAEAGYTEAMRELASRFQTGSGTAQDIGAAKEWYKKAADAGDQVAAAKLRDLTTVVQAANVPPPSAGVKPLDMPAKQQNRAKKQDNSEKEKGSVQAPGKEKERPITVATVTKPPVSEKRTAAEDKSAALSKVAEYEKAVEAGDPQAKVALADITKNTHKAYALYLEAANAGYLPAMRRLAECHIHGRGTSVSEIDGINWYRKAAWAGDAESVAILKQKGKTLY